MKVTSKQEAWNKVNEIFPTDYEQDLGSSDRAGYPIYRSTAEGHYYDYICDLGNRLEVNLDSSHLATVNIWIEEPAKAEDNVQAGAEAMHAAKALGQTISPLYDNRQFTLITLCVDGDRYIANDTMRKVYDGLKRGESWLAGDLIASYSMTSTPISSPCCGASKMATSCRSSSPRTNTSSSRPIRTGTPCWPVL